MSYYSIDESLFSELASDYSSNTNVELVLELEELGLYLGSCRTACDFESEYQQNRRSTRWYVNFN